MADIILAPAADDPERLAWRDPDGIGWTDTLSIAKASGRDHRNVLAAAREEMRSAEAAAGTRAENSAGVQNQAVSWFREVMRPDAQGQPRPVIEMTEDGALQLVGGFTGELGRAVRRRLIMAFRELRQVAARDVAPMDIGEECRKIVATVQAITAGFGQLAVRVEETRAGLDDVRADVRHMRNRVEELATDAANRRKNITAKTKERHLDALRALGGRCPGCGSRPVLDTVGNRLAGTHFDHMEGRPRTAFCDTWLICEPCHIARHGGADLRAEFVTYHRKAARLAKAQAELPGLTH